MLVGIGHPRCGTGFTTELINASGLELGHERIAADGVVSWMALAERKCVPIGKPVGPLQGHRVFCIARSPLAAIRSIVPENRNIRSFGWRAAVIWEKTGVDLFCRKQVRQSDVGYAVATFTYWFKIALSLNPELVFRVDRDEDDAKLSDFLGRPVARAPSLDRNSRPQNRFEGFEPEMLARIPGRLRDDFTEVTGALGYPEDADVIASFG